MQSSQEKESNLSNRRALSPGQKIALIKDNHEFVDIDSSIPTVNEWDDNERLKGFVEVDGEEKVEEDVSGRKPAELV